SGRVAALRALRSPASVPPVALVRADRTERGRQVDRGAAAGARARRHGRGARAGRAVDRGPARRRRGAPALPVRLVAAGRDDPSVRAAGGVVRDRGPARAGAAAGTGAVLRGALPGLDGGTRGARGTAARPAEVARVGRRRADR